MKSSNGNTIGIPSFLIRDYPSIKYRGLFNEDKWGPDRMTLEDYKDMIDYMASIKMNTLSLEFMDVGVFNTETKYWNFLCYPSTNIHNLIRRNLLNFIHPKKVNGISLIIFQRFLEQDFFGDLIKYGKTKHVTVYPVLIVWAIIP